MLDGATPFTLTLTTATTDAASSVTQLTAAITNAGLAARLGVARVDALHANAPAGNYIQSNSLNVAGNPDRRTSSFRADHVGQPEVEAGASAGWP